MKLSIITLTFNKLKYTKKYIESLFKYTKDFELIIVDNGSTDGTVEYLKSLTYDNLKFIFNSENLGFSKGNNQGIEIAEGEYIGFLNNDILLCPNWFEECEKVFEKENAAFVSPREINSRTEKTNEKKYLKYFKTNFKQNNTYEKNFYKCNFSCALTKKEILSKIGNFDEYYTPAFYEDDDFKYRAIIANYDIYVSNAVCFYHFGSATSKKLDFNLVKNQNYYHSKYPLAEYLTILRNERDAYKKIILDFQNFPLKQIYSIFIIFRKSMNRLKKIFRRKRI